MATKKTTTVKRSVCPQTPTIPPIQIPALEFSRIFDQVMQGQRLILALHRIEQEKRSEGLATSGELIAWEAFLALNSACDELGHHAGYEVDEREPE